MVEVQALVCRTNFNMPRRTAAGMDYNRVNLLMAVIEKRLGLSLANWDAYINIAGGMKLNVPALDLAVVAAIISSYKDLPSMKKRSYSARSDCPVKCGASAWPLNVCRRQKSLASKNVFFRQ